MLNGEWLFTIILHFLLVDNRKLTDDRLNLKTLIKSLS
jgi:hypothetical protein